MLKAKLVKAAWLVGFTLEYQTQAVSAVGVFESAINILELLEG